MLKRAPLILAAPLFIALTSLVAGPAMAQTTDVLDLTFNAQNIDGSTLSGSVQIPALTAGSTVTGSGTVTIVYGGQVVYSGGFSATTLKSITPPSASLSPIVSVSTPATVSYYGGALLPSSTVTNGPIVTNDLLVGVVLSGQCTSSNGSTCVGAGPGSSADLLLYSTNTKTLLDVGITLTGSVSAMQAAAAVGLVNAPSQTAEEWFINVAATAAGSNF